jgi:hypothetical protein
MGHSVELDPSSVFFIRENQISTGTYMYNGNQNNVSLFLPDSRLFTLEKPIDTLVSSLNSRSSIVRNRGPLWLLTNDSNDSGDQGLFPIDSETKDALHKDFLQYGIMDGQRKAIITDAKLKLQTVGFDVAQLKLLEGEVQDAKHICDGLDYPPYLMGLVDAKFDNQDIAERALYTNAIIPDATSEDEQLAILLGLDKLGLTITTDYSHLPALQEDDVKRSTARLLLDQSLKLEFDCGLITRNQWLEKLGEPPIGPEGDVRSTDVNDKNVPLATLIGVGGVQSLISVLTSAGLSSEARSNTLQILFGIDSASADLMVAGSDNQENSNDSSDNNQQ